jgi:hypothetical protein
MLEFARCFDLASAELGDAGGLLEDRASLERVGHEHRIDLALLDDRVGVVADTGVKEEFADVAEANLLGVD